MPRSISYRSASAMASRERSSCTGGTPLCGGVLAGQCLEPALGIEHLGAQFDVRVLPEPYELGVVLRCLRRLTPALVQFSQTVVGSSQPDRIGVNAIRIRLACVALVRRHG